MGRVVQFRQKPTKLAGQGRPGGKAVNPPADALTIILAVAAAGLVVLRLWPVVRVPLRFRHPRLERPAHVAAVAPLSRPPRESKTRGPRRGAPVGQVARGGEESGGPDPVARGGSGAGAAVRSGRSRSTGTTPRRGPKGVVEADPVVLQP
jgi:hypothetical protein